MAMVADRPGRAPAPVRRRTVLGALASVGVLAATIGVFRHEGFPSHRVLVASARRWLIHRPTGTVSLADPASGRVVLKLSSQRAANLLDAAQGPTGAVLIDRTRSEVLPIDQQHVRLGPARSVPVLADPTDRWTFGLGADGVVALTGAGTGAVLPPNGPMLEIRRPASSGAPVLTAAGRLWSLDTSGEVTTLVGPAGDGTELNGVSADAAITAVGDDVVVLERQPARLTWNGGSRHAMVIAGEIDTTDAVLQITGDARECTWLGTGDELVCIGRSGVVRRVPVIGSFQFARSDRLAVTADVAVVLSATGSLVRIDLNSGDQQPVPFSWRSTERLLAADRDTVWIDDPSGPITLGVSRRGVVEYEKLDERAPTFGPEGEPLSVGGSVPGAETAEVSAQRAADTDAGVPGRRPDDDGRAEPPIAVNDLVTAVATDSILIAVTDNDFDPDGDPITVEGVQPPGRGIAQVVSTGLVEYRPDVGFVGSDRFTYEIVDSTGKSAQATVSLEIRPQGGPNATPTAIPDARSTAAGVPVEVDVLDNDVDPERTPLIIGRLDAPDAALGAVEVVQRPDGQDAIRFSPSAAAAGRTVVVSYTAVDAGGLQSPPAMVTVDVGAIDAANRLPIAAPDSAQVRAGRTARVPVLDNDIDPDNDPLAIVSAYSPNGLGQVTTVGGQLAIATPANAAGSYLVNYTVRDPAGATASAAVLIKVLPADSENRAPLLQADLRLTGGSQIEIDPRGNDVDPDGDRLVIDGFDPPAFGGTVEQLADGTLRFTPDPDFTGITGFTYYVSDGNGQRASAEVTINVDRRRTPSPPVARDDTAQTLIDRPVEINALANDGDPTGESPTLVNRFGCPAGATCALTADQRRVVFTPPAQGVGTFEVTYTISNRAGRQATATIRITVSAPQERVDPAPVADDDVTTVEAGGRTVIDVLRNDIATDGDALRIVSITQPPARLGTAVISRGQIEFTAGVDAGGQVAEFEYTIEDPAGQRSRAEVAVRILTVTDTNAVPEAEPDIRSTTPGTAIVIPVLENDRDPDGTVDDLRLTDVRTLPGLQASVDIVGRSVRVTPSDQSLGVIRAVYEIVDAEGASDTATIEVNVEPSPNRAPVAVDEAVSTASAVAVTVDVTNNDRDPDGDQLAVALLRTPPESQGHTELIGSRVKFTPASGFDGVAVVTYEVRDPAGLASNPASLAITVSACGAVTPSAPDRPGEFTPFATPLSLTLLTPDQVNNTLSIGTASGGTVVRSGDSNVVFTPAAGNNGRGEFDYTVRNACGQARTGRVTIDVNRSPIVRDLSRTTERNQPLGVALAEQASDDEAIQYVSATADSGAVSIIDGGSALIYTPSNGFAGSARIDVSVADAGNLRSAATIAVEVTAPANKHPHTDDDSYATEAGTRNQIDVIGNDHDPDGDHSMLRVELVDATVDINGVVASLSVDADGRTVIMQVPAGAHGKGTFRYRAVDAEGARSSPATVKVTINSRPNSVVTSITLQRGGSTELRPLNWPGVSDPDGDPVKVVRPTSSAGILVELDGENLIRAWATADAPDTGVITFTLIDSYGATNTSTINVQIWS